MRCGFSSFVRRKYVQNSTEIFLKLLPAGAFLAVTSIAVFSFFSSARPKRIDSAMLTIYDPGLCMGRLSESKSPFLLNHGRAVKPVVVDNPVGRELDFGMVQAKTN